MNRIIVNNSNLVTIYIFQFIVLVLLHSWHMLASSNETVRES